MVPAICILHNFIQVHDADDLPVVNDLDGTSQAQSGQLGSDISSGERSRAMVLRESITKAMWESYQRIVNTDDI